MMLLERLQAKPCLPADELRHDLHAWVGAGYEQQLDAALTAFLAAPKPPATPANVITNLTLELVRPLHRAIFCSEFHLDPATGLECGAATTGSAPSLRQIDQRITAHLERVTNQVTKADVAAMADAEGGRAVIGQLGAAGCARSEMTLASGCRQDPSCRARACGCRAGGDAARALAGSCGSSTFWRSRRSSPCRSTSTGRTPDHLWRSARRLRGGVALLLGALILVFPSRIARRINSVAGVFRGPVKSLVQKLL